LRRPRGLPEQSLESELNQITLDPLMPRGARAGMDSRRTALQSQPELPGHDYPSLLRGPKHAVARFAAPTRHSTLSRFTSRQISVACWKKSRRWLTFTWSGSRVVVKRNSCRQSPWYPFSSPFYCWASRRHTPRRGVPSTVAGEVERIVASIPFNNAWPRSREMVGSAPRTNSKIPIGVVGRGPVRGEVRLVSSR